MQNSDKPKGKFFRIVFKEILGELIGVFLGSVTTKIGGSIVFLVIGMVFIFSPIVGLQDKPLFFYVSGIFLLVISVYLFVRRWNEIKHKNDY